MILDELRHFRIAFVHIHVLLLLANGGIGVPSGSNLCDPNEPRAMEKKLIVD